MSCFFPNDHAAVLDDGDEIDRNQRARPVRDHDDDAAACPDALDGRGERRLALAVEIGVRLVHDHEERVAVECARKPDALPLPGGERQPCGPSLVRSLRQA